MFSGLVAFLYYGCFLLLIGLVLFIALKGSRRSYGLTRLQCTFFLLALSLLIWQSTLFLEIRIALPVSQLWLGRANFAAVVFTAYLALRFVQEVSKDGSKRTMWSLWLLGETWLLAVLTLLTPLIDAAEQIVDSRAITTYGVLFPAYLLHVVGYLVASLVLAFRERRRATHRAVKGQLTLIGVGMLVTGGVALTTNALLPYGFGDFRFCDIGTISTVFFLLSVAYAIFIHRLFDLKIILRETLVYGVLLAFVLGAYSSTVFLISQYLTSDTGKLTQFAVLFIAFSFDPLRRFLEKKTDRLLFGERSAAEERKKKRGGKKGSRSESRFMLALLFPWHRH